MRGSVTAVAAACALCAVQAIAGQSKLRTIDVSRALDAGAGAPAPTDIVITATPPDPPPLVEKRQWVFDLRWDRGEIWLLDVQERTLAVAQPTPRAMGRFALELFEGPTLVERVRFDFPLLGAAPDADGGVSFTAKLRTRIGVLFPATQRGTRLELLDRATGRRWSLPWPPLSSGAPDDGGARRP
ncbi:MAG TPA: hypothetical protein VE987_04375 [Polyangiaceae bacterium]|nr:hypothetical protein [Polyangiaceae bacterium]